MPLWIFGKAGIEPERSQYNTSQFHTRCSDPATKSTMKIGIYAYEECTMYLSFRNGDVVIWD